MRLGRRTIWMRTSISSSGTQARVVLPGIGGRRGKNGGYAVVHGTSIASPESWELVVHEMGHAFGLRHDDRNSCVLHVRRPSWHGIGSPHALPNSCPCIPTSMPRPRRKKGRRPPSSSSRRLDIQPAQRASPSNSGSADPQGIHQVILFVSQFPDVELKACLGSGEPDGRRRRVRVRRGDSVRSLHKPFQPHRTSDPGRSAVDADGNVHRETYGLEEISSYRIATLEGHTDVVEAVAFSPDGARLASGSHDGTANLWDVAAEQRDRHPSRRYG